MPIDETNILQQLQQMERHFVEKLDEKLGMGEYVRQHAELGKRIDDVEGDMKGLRKEVADNKDHYIRLYQEGTAWANTGFTEIRNLIASMSAPMQTMQAQLKTLIETGKERKMNWIQVGITLLSAFVVCTLSFVFAVWLLHIKP